MASSNEALERQGNESVTSGDKSRGEMMKTVMSRRIRRIKFGQERREADRLEQLMNKMKQVINELRVTVREEDEKVWREERKRA